MAFSQFWQYFIANALSWFYNLDSFPMNDGCSLLERVGNMDLFSISRPIGLVYLYNANAQTNLGMQLIVLLAFVCAKTVQVRPIASSDVE